MKFRTVMVTAAAAALSFAAVSSAAAQTLGHAGQHRATRQITGSRLARGLLPASAFGPDFTDNGSTNSGGKLSSTRVRYTPGSLSCGSWVDNTYLAGWGNTAAAAASFLNSAWTYQNSAFTLYSAFEEAFQFPTAHAASTYFNQSYAKFAGCKDFLAPNPTDSAPGGGSWDVSQTSTRKTTVGGHPGFWTDELWTLSENTSFSQYVEVLFAVSGTNVYYIWENNGTNDEPSPALLSALIHRVQGLY